MQANAVSTKGTRFIRNQNNLGTGYCLLYSHAYNNLLITKVKSQ